MGYSRIYRGKGPPPNYVLERDRSNNTKETVLIVGGLALLALALFGGMGAGFGGGDDPGSGGSPGGSPGAKKLVLIAGGESIRTEAGLIVFTGPPYKWVADADTMLAKVTEIALFPSKGSQALIQSFKDWMQKNRPEIELGEYEEV